jgi:hypothetical protein
MEKQNLNVVVHFAPADEPFKDHNASREETVGHLETRVLTAFGLSEGATPDGGQVVYTLYHDRQALDNPAATLGELAGDKHVLQLKLDQQVTQGQ